MSTSHLRWPTGSVAVWLAFCATAAGITPVVISYKPVIFFSTEKPFVATRGPWAGKTISPGDLLTSWGSVIPNGQLTRNFYPMPPKADYGLDAIAMAVTTTSATRETLFSTTTSFFDERQGRTIGKGDILSDRGAVVMTNTQLLGKFGPRSSPTGPTLLDYGLDGFQMAPLAASNASATSNILFTTEQPFYSSTLGRMVGEGDLLSSGGQVVMSNAQILKNFHPVPTMTSFAPTDYGLDGFRAMAATDTWFTIEKGFWDTALNKWVGPGDLLSTSGRVVLTNQQLLSAFLGPAVTNSGAPMDYGLDAFWAGYLPITPISNPYANPLLAAEAGSEILSVNAADFLNPVPEPGTLILLSLGLSLLGGRRRK